jgi:ABC-type nitrate/sulfonate/bicarbonate transport system substrate-binding protein
MNKKILVIVVIIVVVVGLYFVVIKKDNQVEKRYSGPVQEVSLKLKWLHQAQFAGNYVAVEKGFYAENGLKVNLVPFSFESPAIDAVVKGDAMFGITGADELVLARANNIPIKAIAVIYKTNPVVAYALKKSGITKPQDFIGKTVGLEKGLNVEYLYSAMMGKLKIDRSKIKEVAIGYDATELLTGKTDVSTGYIINEPNLAIEAGQEVNTILVADYGVNMYADVLFAREDTIQTQPELVERFLRATLDGWQYAIEHEEEAVSMVLKYASSSTSIHQAHMLKSSIPLIHNGDFPLGWMEDNKWKEAEDILLEQKILKNPIIINDAYTMQFLNSIYKRK